MSRVLREMPITNEPSSSELGDLKMPILGHPPQDPLQPPNLCPNRVQTCWPTFWLIFCLRFWSRMSDLFFQVSLCGLLLSQLSLDYVFILSVSLEECHILNATKNYFVESFTSWQRSKSPGAFRSSSINSQPGHGMMYCSG
jgi:hypothetical protein